MSLLQSSLVAHNDDHYVDDWMRDAPPPIFDGGVGQVRDYESAFELLQSAARALELLQSKREQLERAVDALEAKYKAAALEAAAKSSEWQKLAVTMRTRAQDCEQRIAAIEHRAEAAERRAEAERQRAIWAEHRAMTSMSVCANFHDRIMAVFGKGSKADKTLSALQALDRSNDRSV